MAPSSNPRPLLLPPLSALTLSSLRRVSLASPQLKSKLFRRVPAEVSTDSVSGNDRIAGSALLTQRELPHRDSHLLR